MTGNMIAGKTNAYALRVDAKYKIKENNATTCIKTTSIGIRLFL